MSPCRRACDSLEELQLERRDRALEGGIAADLGSDVVELRARPPVAAAEHVGVGEDQVLGDLAQLGVAGERGHQLALLGRRQRHVRGVVECGGQIFRDVRGELGIDHALDHAAAHDDVRPAALHGDQVQPLVEVQQLGNPLPGVAGLDRGRTMLEPGPLQVQRPALADQPDIGQRLLDAQVTGRAVDDEDQVEVAVADLAHLPGRGLAAEPRADGGQRGQVLRHGLDVERAVALGRADGQDTDLPDRFQPPAPMADCRTGQIPTAMPT